MKTRVVLIAGAVAAVAAAGPASALVGTPSLALTQQKAAGGGNGSDNGIHDTKRSQREYCNDEKTRWIEYQGPTSIWPPNHKMRNYTIVAHDDEGGNVTLATFTSSSQVANGTGDGNTDTDYVDTTPVGADMGQGEARNTGQIRGERSGNDKAGRTYTMDSTATWSDMSTCNRKFTAHVPHDQRDQANTGSGKTPKKSARRGARRR